MKIFKEKNVYKEYFFSHTAFVHYKFLTLLNNNASIIKFGRLLSSAGHWQDSFLIPGAWDKHDKIISLIFPHFPLVPFIFLKFSSIYFSFWSSGWAASASPPGKALATPLGIGPLKNVRGSVLKFFTKSKHAVI